MSDFSTGELALLHQSIHDTVRVNYGGHFKLSQPGLHEQLLEDDNYRQLIELENKLLGMLVVDE